MALPNDSILVTPGSGATLATELISGKEYGAWIEVDGYGHIPGARDLWCYSWIDGDTLATANNNRGVLAIWNGTGSGKTVEIVGAQVTDSNTAARDGVSNVYFSRITAEATDGGGAAAASTLTARKVCRSSAGSLPAQITALGCVNFDARLTFTRTGDPLFVGSFHCGTTKRATDLLYHHIMPWTAEPVLLGENDGGVLTVSDINGFYRGFVALYFRVR